MLSDMRVVLTCEGKSYEEVVESFVGVCDFVGVGDVGVSCLHGDVEELYS